MNGSLPQGESGSWSPAGRSVEPPFQGKTLPGGEAGSWSPAGRTIASDMFVPKPSPTPEPTPSFSPPPAPPTMEPVSSPQPDWQSLFRTAHGTAFDANSKMDQGKLKIMQDLAAQGVDTSNANAFARKLYAAPAYRQAYPGAVS